MKLSSRATQAAASEIRKRHNGAKGAKKKGKNKTKTIRTLDASDDLEMSIKLREGPKLNRASPSHLPLSH